MATHPTERIRVPLSLLQTQMWEFEQSSPTPGFYNEAIRHRFSAPVDVQALSAAVAAIAGRHEALRTRFPTDDNGPYQSVMPSVPTDLPVTDLRNIAPEEQDAERRRLSAQEQRAPFDLATGPLFRTRLFELGNGSSELLLVLDHIVADDTTMSLVLTEVLAEYAALSTGHDAGLPELELQYADFAVWERQWFTPDREQAQRSYWREKLRNVPATRGVPYGLDVDPAGVDLSLAPRAEAVVFSSELRARLVDLARVSRTGLSVICTTAVQALIAFSTSDTDTLIMTTYSGRDRHELERMAGLFGGLGFLRTDLSDSPPFEVALRRARATALGLLQNHHVPILTVLDDLRNDGTGLGMPAVPVALHFFHASRERWAPGTSVIASPPPRSGPLDEPIEAGKPLDIRFYDDGTSLWAIVAYHPECFAPGAIEEFAADLQHLLELVSNDPLLPVSRSSLEACLGREVTAGGRG